MSWVIGIVLVLAGLFAVVGYLAAKWVKDFDVGNDWSDYD